MTKKHIKRFAIKLRNAVENEQFVRFPVARFKKWTHEEILELADIAGITFHGDAETIRFFQHA